MEKQAYFNIVVPLAQAENAKYGVLASVCIAMSCVESTWGDSHEASVDNNILGIKIPGNHNPDFTITQGDYATDDGGYYAHYQSWAECVDDYGYFLRNNSRYTDAGLFNQTTAEGQLQAIMDAGYAGSAYRDLALQIINENNLTQYDSGVTPPTDDSAAKVESAVTWMINIANDDTHGYDQDSRWGPDYDCSSFVISGYEQAGIPLKTNGATYTGDLKAVALSTGFTEVDWGNDVSKLVRGDIILNEVHHVCCYIGNGQIVQASQNELGHATGGQTGDQTGTEIYVRDYYVYSSGWDCVLRYKNGSTGGGTGGTTGEVWNKIKASSYNVNQLTAEQTTFLKTLKFTTKVKIKFTYDRRKYNGVNFTGKRLTIDDLSYIIVDVENNGFVKLTNDTNNKCYKFVNPKLLKGV